MNFRNSGAAGDIKDHTHMVSGHQRGVLSVQVTDCTKLKDFSIWRHNTGQMWLLKGHYSGKRGSARKRSGRSSPDGKYSGSLLL